MTDKEMTDMPDIVRRQVMEAKRIAEKHARGEAMEPSELFFASLTLDLGEAMKGNDRQYLEFLFNALTVYLYESPDMAMAVACQTRPQ